MNDRQTYRLQVYERFSELIHRENVRWIMLHGAEDYPQSIGRDLDCLCASSRETMIALRCFEQAAREQAETKWVLYPHPIWGQRCVALSKDYQTAELHILDSLSSGPLHHRVDFDAVDQSAVFPQEKEASVIKSVVMPLLGNSPKVLHTLQQHGERQFPACIREAADSLRAYGRIRMPDRLRLYVHYFENPFSSAYSLLCSVRKKALRYTARTVPVYFMQEAEAEYLMENLGEIFLKSVDCTHLGRAHIRRLQSLQVLLYVRKKESAIPDVEDTQNLRGADLCEFVVNGFAAHCKAQLQ